MKYYWYLIHIYCQITNLWVTDILKWIERIAESSRIYLKYSKSESIIEQLLPNTSEKMNKTVNFLMQKITCFQQI